LLLDWLNPALEIDYGVAQKRGSKIPEGNNIQFGFINILETAAGMKDTGYRILRNLLHPYEVKALISYYKQAEELGHLRLDDTQWRYTSYNDRVGFVLNRKVEPIISQIIGRPVKRAYSFLCGYEFKQSDKQPNLNPHTDREDNEYTISVQLGAILEDKSADPESTWPLLVHANFSEKDGRPSIPPRWREFPAWNEIIEAWLRDGDALIFEGRKHIHMREPMPFKFKAYTSLLLHFVDSKFDFVDFMNRRRKDGGI